MHQPPPPREGSAETFSKKQKKIKTSDTLAQLTTIRDQLLSATIYSSDGNGHTSLGAPTNHVPTYNQAATVAAVALTTAAIADLRGFDSLANAARNISQTASAYHPLADASILAAQCTDIRAFLHPAGAHNPAQQPRAPLSTTAIAQPPLRPATTPSS
jgi:hypothetical protein